MILNRASQAACLLGVLICLSFPLSAADRGQDGIGEKPLSFGVAPFMSPLALLKRLAPLRQYLSDTISHEVVIETAPDAKEFARRSVEGNYDIILTNPTFATMVVDAGQYRLLLTQEKSLSGVLVVMENSAINSVDDLAGKTIGTPPRVGFLGQLAKPYIHDIGLKGDRAAVLKPFHSHNDSTAALRIGKIDASFIAGFMKQHLIDKGMKIREISRSPTFPGLTLLAHNRLASPVMDNIQGALLRLGESEVGQKLLKKISMSRFRTIEPAELDVVRPYLPKK